MRFLTTFASCVTPSACTLTILVFLTSSRLLNSGYRREVNIKMMQLRTVYQSENIAQSLPLLAYKQRTRGPVNID